MVSILDVMIRFLGSVTQDLSPGELAMVGALGIVLSTVIWGQISRRCIVEVVRRIFLRLRLGIILFGILFLVISRLYGWASQQTGELTSAMREFDNNRAAKGELPILATIKVVVYTLGAVIGVVSLVWAVYKTTGGRPGQPKQQVANNIYMVSPDSMASKVTQVLDAAPKTPEVQDISDRFARELAEIKSEMSDLKSFFQEMYLSNPSANFVSFMLEDLTTKVEDRFDEIGDQITQVESKL
jgi:hypothetical protein